VSRRCRSRDLLPRTTQDAGSPDGFEALATKWEQWSALETAAAAAGGKSSLGDAKSSLGDATSSLGDATSSLGDARSSLGGAKSSLGDARSSLGDAKVPDAEPLRSGGRYTVSLGTSLAQVIARDMKVMRTNPIDVVVRAPPPEREGAY
jgi:hypothetical protein